MDTTYRIPPDLDVTKPEEGLDELYTERKTKFEPGCEDLWCGLKHADHWRGPAGLAQLGKAVCTGSASRSGTTTADRVDDTLTSGQMIMMQAHRLEVQASSDRADDALTSGQNYEVGRPRPPLRAWVTPGFARIRAEILKIVFFPPNMWAGEPGITWPDGP
mmetsp:Transcript_774/g.2037  ORF Transcript_774/g.2037 Transcript_774/m.2037 type:complete len:161 (-) Transcript_774:114-596(-)